MNKNVFITPRSIVAVLLWLFTDMLKVAKKKESPDVNISNWGQTRLCLAFLFQLLYCKQATSLVSLLTCFSYFCAFCWRCSYLNGPEVKSCLVFWTKAVNQNALAGQWLGLSFSTTKCASSVSGRETKTVNWVTVLLDMSSMWTNQQYILNKVTQINTNKTSLGIDH